MNKDGTAERRDTRWEKVFRGHKKKDKPIFEGMKAYYNFTKKHDALKDKSPSESAMILVDEKNRWKAII